MDKRKTLALNLVTLLAGMSAVACVAFGQRTDPFNEASYQSITQPPTHAETLTIGGQDHELDWTPRGLRNGTEEAGDVTVRMLSGEVFTYRNIQPGAREVGRFSAVLASGSTLVDVDLLGDK